MRELISAARGHTPCKQRVRFIRSCSCLSQRNNGGDRISFDHHRHSAKSHNTALLPRRWRLLWGGRVHGLWSRVEVGRMRANGHRLIAVLDGKTRIVRRYHAKTRHVLHHSSNHSVGAYDGQSDEPVVVVWRPCKVCGWHRRQCDPLHKSE